MAKGLINTDILIKELEGFADEHAAEVAEKTKRDAYEYSQAVVPVDTGLLKSKIRAVTIKMPFGYTVVLFVDLDEVSYALYVERPTVNTPAQPYIEPAIIEAYQRNF